MTEEENRLFDMMQLAEEMSLQNWRTLRGLYNEKFKEAQQRNKELETAIRDWADAIVDWEGIDFVDRIKNEKSRAVIEAALGGEKNASA